MEISPVFVTFEALKPGSNYRFSDPMHNIYET
jgi:hypothetical protein